MNYLSMATVIAATAALFLALVSVRRNPRASLNWAVALGCVDYAVWALGSAFTFSATDGTSFWPALKVGLVGYIFVQSFSIWVVAQFAGLSRKTAGFLLLPTVLVSLVEAWQALTSTWIISGYHQTSWGMAGILTSDGFWVTLDLVKGGIAMLTNLGILAWSWRNNPSRRHHRMILVFLTFILVSRVVSRFTIWTVWQSWGYPDPTVLANVLGLVAYAILITRYRHLDPPPSGIPSHVFRALPDLVFQSDPHGNLFQTTERFARLFGHTEDSIRGTPLGSLLKDWPTLPHLWLEWAKDPSSPRIRQGKVGTGEFILHLFPERDRFHDVTTVLGRLVPTTPLDEAAGAFGLTPREREVAALMLEGWGTREMADGLFISTATVRNHVQSLFRKTGTARRVDLIRLLLQPH